MLRRQGPSVPQLVYTGLHGTAFMVAASPRLVHYSQDGHCPKGCVQSAHSRVTLDMQDKFALCSVFSILRSCEI